MIEAITIIIYRILAAHLADKYGRRPVFFYSFLIMLLAVFFISEINTLKILIITAVLFWAESSLCSPALAAFIADKTDPSARGTVFRFFYGAFDAGVIIASVILSFVADLTGIRDMFMITAIAGFIALILFSLLIRKGIVTSLKWTMIPEIKVPKM